MDLHGKNLIGSTISGEGKYTFRAYSPTLSQGLEPDFYEATPEEIKRTMELAEIAFEDYRQKSPERRAEFLERMAAEIEGLGDELIDRCAAETALPEARLISEKGRTVNQIRMFASLVREGSWVNARIDSADPNRDPLPKPDLRLMMMPLGPVVVFGASNFPLAFSVGGGDTASALAAGCSVVVKAHRSHPGTAELVGRAIHRAVQATGMPKGLFSVLHGRGREVGTELVKHPSTRAVGFTGSLKGGRALFDLAASRLEPIPVYAEMGSLNPVFVLPGALEYSLEAFAEGLQQSVTLGVGQFCTNPGLVVGLKGEKMDRFITKIELLFLDTPPATMLHHGILASYEAGVQALKEAQDVRLVGMTSIAVDSKKTEAGAHVFSTDMQTFLESSKLSEEVFGPSTLIVTCESKSELEKVASNLEGHLTATIHGTEKDLTENPRLISILERKVGRLIFNGFPTGVEVCASMNHGGPYPASSDGRSTSVGTAAIYRFTRLVSYQSFPQSALPSELKNDNPESIWRLVDNELTKDAV